MLEKFTQAYVVGLKAVRATALSRLGSDAVAAGEACAEAETLFDAMIASNNEGAGSLLLDYVVMLVEFDKTRKGVQVLQSPSGLKIPSAAYSTLGRSLKAIGDPDALELLRTAATMAPTARNLSDLADAMDAAGDPNGAYREFMRAVGMALQTGDQQLALQAIERAVTLRPHDNSARQLRGFVLWKAGDIGRAVEDFTAVVNANPDDSRETRVALARALLDWGDPEQAIAHIDIAQKNSANQDPPALRGKRNC